jgi:propionyl-CoA carboxylase alpha chain/3-methylcrotonyl-CoA carboxylase alpha subunit/acetyl-CoA/propionyl-CoA carboxylase biotin carboxyl carrier protein
VLIANRGEIACRILRTLRAQDIASVAVYHHEDRAAPHVRLADAAVPLDADVPSAAYLDQAQIIEAARHTGADAIHPGYGFLSENAAFAERVADAGLSFVGPEPETIRLMGTRSGRIGVCRGTACVVRLLEASRPVAAPRVLLPHQAAAAGARQGYAHRTTGGLPRACARCRGGRAALRRLRVFRPSAYRRPDTSKSGARRPGNGAPVRASALAAALPKVLKVAGAESLREAVRPICAAVRLARAARYRNAGTVEFVAPDGQFISLK